MPFNFGVSLFFSNDLCIGDSGMLNIHYHCIMSWSMFLGPIVFLL